MIRTETPPAHAFTHRFAVVRDDIDALGHANNVIYVRWVQDVAVAHSRSVGLTWAFYQELGAIFVVRRHEIDYLAPAMEGEEIEATTWVEPTRGVVSVRKTILRRASDAKIIAQACTTWVLLDTTTGKPRRLTPDLMGRFDSPPVVS